MHLQVFEQACLSLHAAGFPVQAGCATKRNGLVKTKGVRLSLQGVGWCSTCHHLKTEEEMQEPGLCKECAEEQKAARGAAAVAAKVPATPL